MDCPRSCPVFVDTLLLKRKGGSLKEETSLNSLIDRVKQEPVSKQIIRLNQVITALDSKDIERLGLCDTSLMVKITMAVHACDQDAEKKWVYPIDHLIGNVRGRLQEVTGNHYDEHPDEEAFYIECQRLKVTPSIESVQSLRELLGEQTSSTDEHADHSPRRKRPRR